MGSRSKSQHRGRKKAASPRPKRGARSAPDPATTGKTVAPHPRRFELSTLRGIRREMAGVYRLARTGEISLTDACRLAYLLTTLGKLSEAELLEQRLNRLEERMEDAT